MNLLGWLGWILAVLACGCAAFFYREACWFASQALAACDRSTENLEASRRALNLAEAALVLAKGKLPDSETLTQFTAADPKVVTRPMSPRGARFYFNVDEDL